MLQGAKERSKSEKFLSLCQYQSSFEWFSLSTQHQLNKT